MVFSLLHFGISILYLVGLRLCIDHSDPWDKVFPDGDPWDTQSSEDDSNISKEDIGNSVFSLLGEGEVLITTHTPPNWSMIPIVSESNKMEIDVPDLTRNEPMTTIETPYSLAENQESNPSTQVFAENILPPKRRPYHNEYTGRRAAIIKKTKFSNKIIEAFAKLKPMTLKPDNLSQEQLEITFVQQKNHDLWREMVDYPLDSCLDYWGQVCDYFWYKSDPADKRFRGCFVTLIVNAKSRARVHFLHILRNDMRPQLLRCSCFYYLLDIKKPDSHETLFAVHKHADNEYFLLNNVPNTKFIFTIDNLVTEVFLPKPVAKSKKRVKSIPLQ